MIMFLIINWTTDSLTNPNEMQTMVYLTVQMIMTFSLFAEIGIAMSIIIIISVTLILRVLRFAFSVH